MTSQPAKAQGSSVSTAACWDAQSEDAAVAAALLAGVTGTDAAVCLCDEADQVRYANVAFRKAFFPELGDRRIDFADAICEATGSGRGIKLATMPLEAFRVRIRERRLPGQKLFGFCVDMHDGSWWWVEDFRLGNGWILAVATNISSIKHEELRLREAHALAVQASQTDFLTGLPNRRCGMEHAEFALLSAQTGGKPLALALVDIDRFKSINDSHGHDAGDEVLMNFARVLSGRLGAADKVSRMGGEEFMVLMPDTPVERAELRLDRLMRSLPPLAPSSGGTEIAYSFSAGIAEAGPGESLKSLIARADSALYRAKSLGRQRIEVSRAAARDAA